MGRHRRARRRVEAKGGQARQPLAEERGCTADGDILEIIRRGTEIAQTDLQTVAAKRADIEQAAADRLADGCGEGRALHLHVQTEDEQRVESHIQYRARHKADHGKEGIALKAQLVIEHEGHAHKRRAAEDDGHIIRREGNGLG